MTLQFALPHEILPLPLRVDIDRLVIAGWTGRDAHAIEHHIAELAQIGVPRPSAVPLFYRVDASQLTQADLVQVVGAQTSGEAEPFLFFHDSEVFVSLASDHTDRALETHSVALSKQICAKPVASAAWRLSDVFEHWDSLVLRSWIEEDGQFVLYQEGTLAQLRGPIDLLERFAAEHSAPREGFAMACGTVSVIGGIRSAPRFRMELCDETTGRRIAHEYRTEVLPLVA